MGIEDEFTLRYAIREMAKFLSQESWISECIGIDTASVPVVKLVIPQGNFELRKDLNVDITIE